MTGEGGCLIPQTELAMRGSYLVSIELLLWVRVSHRQPGYLGTYAQVPTLVGPGFPSSAWIPGYLGPGTYTCGSGFPIVSLDTRVPRPRYLYLWIRISHRRLGYLGT